MTELKCVETFEKKIEFLITIYRRSLERSRRNTVGSPTRDERARYYRDRTFTMGLAYLKEHILPDLKRMSDETERNPAVMFRELVRDHRKDLNDLLKEWNFDPRELNNKDLPSETFNRYVEQLAENFES